MKDINGININFDERFREIKAILIVNIVSNWPNADIQYKQLLEICEEWNDKGFEVIAFPCDQFTNQEIKSQEEIRDYIENTYGDQFRLMEKITIKGEDQHPLFYWLKMNTGIKDLEISGNFGKFLVIPGKRKTHYYLPEDEPLKCKEKWRKIAGF